MSERVIYKYDLDVRDVQVVHMPRVAEVLSVQFQRGMIRLWAKVDPLAETIERTFVIRGTGHPLPEGKLTYLDSVQQDDFVWHVFEASR